MIFDTKNGAKYEVEGNHVRMINYDAKDREWRNFKAMTTVAPGRRVTFLWKMEMIKDDNAISMDTSTTDVITAIEMPN